MYKIDLLCGAISWNIQAILALVIVLIGKLFNCRFIEAIGYKEYLMGCEAYFRFCNKYDMFYAEYIHESYLQTQETLESLTK